MAVPVLLYDSEHNTNPKHSKSPTYAVNPFRRFPGKLENRVSRTVLKYDVFLTYIFVSKDN
jgi:hypothetical protein